MANPVCRFAYECTRTDCKFVHLSGRRIDSPVVPAAVPPGTNAIALLERKWAAVLGALQQGDVLLLVELYSLPPCVAWKPLLRALFEHGLVTMQNDEAEMRALFQQIGRANLLFFERFPAADRSTTLKDLKVRLRRLAGRTLILVDGDNFPNAPTIGLDLFPPPLPPSTDLGFLVVCFVSQAANFKAFQRAVDQPWFYFVHAQTNAKDAADHVLTGTAFVANEIADVTSRMFVLSRDGFARETVETLKTLEPERDIRLISPQQFGEVLRALGAKAGYHTKGIVAPVPSPGMQQQPRFAYEVESPPSRPRTPSPPRSPPLVQTRGPLSMPAQLLPLRAPGPSSAASLLPRMAPQQIYRSVAEAAGVSPEGLVLPRDTERPWAGYRCKICGKDGGLPDSHWEELCPLPSSGPPSSSSSSTSADRTRPWRDYVCPFCHKPGGLPDSHYHWACPQSPGDGTPPPAGPPKYVIETPDGRTEAPPDAAFIWRQEAERFARFVAILKKLYVDRDILAVRLSTLGVVMRENFVYSEKAGLKPLVERAVELKLGERRGEQGNAELVLLKDPINTFATQPQVSTTPPRA